MSQVVEVASTMKVYRPRTVFLEREYGSDHVDMGFRLDLFRKDGERLRRSNHFKSDTYDRL